MKLRYYLRGIGAGIIFTAIIYSFIIIPRRDTMTDDEIIKAAKELGMVEKTTYDLSGILSTSTPAPTETPLPTETPAPTDTPTPTTAQSPTDTPTPTESQSPTDMPTPSITTTPMVSPTPTETLISTPMPTDKPTTTITPTPKTESNIKITIKSGMTSEEFTNELYKYGLIDDTKAFNQYLSKNGYDEDIRVGTFYFNIGMSYKEIADIVTK